MVGNLTLCVLAKVFALDLRRAGDGKGLKIVMGVAACELEEWACWYRAGQRLAKRSLFLS